MKPLSRADGPHADGFSGLSGTQNPRSPGPGPTSDSVTSSDSPLSPSENGLNDPGSNRARLVHTHTANISTENVLDKLEISRCSGEQHLFLYLTQ